MTRRESRIIIVTAMRWCRAHERRRAALAAGKAKGTMREVVQRERELIAACAAAMDDTPPAPATWRLPLRVMRAVAVGFAFMAVQT